LGKKSWRIKDKGTRTGRAKWKTRILLHCRNVDSAACVLTWPFCSAGVSMPLRPFLLAWPSALRRASAACIMCLLTWPSAVRALMCSVITSLGSPGNPPRWRLSQSRPPRVSSGPPGVSWVLIPVVRCSALRRVTCDKAPSYTSGLLCKLWPTRS
jgi:hypothetical protein